MGSDIDIAGLSEKSFQEIKIVEICEKIVYNKMAVCGLLTSTVRIYPTLCLFLQYLEASAREKAIYEMPRLRIKECDRLSAISQCLNAIGGKVTELEDGLEIEALAH